MRETSANERQIWSVFFLIQTQTVLLFRFSAPLVAPSAVGAARLQGAFCPVAVAVVVAAAVATATAATRAHPLLVVRALQPSAAPRQPSAT